MCKHAGVYAKVTVTQLAAGATYRIASPFCSAGLQEISRGSGKKYEGA